MAKMNSLIVNALVAMFIMFVQGCTPDEQGVVGSSLAPAKTAIPEYYIPEDSANVTVIYSNGTSKPHVKHVWRLSAEDTIRVNGTEGFKATETLSKKAQDDMFFMYNYSKVNRLTVTGLAMVYEGRTIYPQSMDNMLVTGSREVVETAAKPFFEMSATNYTLVYGALVLASARQMFLVDEGYVPAFERAYVINRDKHNIGTVEAKLANNKINITGLDSLLYAELFDDGSLRNEGRLPFHSFNECSLSISGQEVNDTTAVVGKSWTGGTASLGGFELSTSWLSNKVSEKNLLATMSTGAKVDFIDSVHVCKWVPAGGKVLSTKKVRVDYAREGQPADKVSVEVGIDLTQREKPVYLLRVDSSFVHNNYVSTVVVNGTNLPVVSNHTATLEKIMNNGTKADKTNVPYKWTNNYAVSYNQNMTVDDLNSVLGRHTVNSNGSVTVAGYNFTVSFVNRVCDNIMYNGKNYKAYAPICKAKVVAITINQNSLVVEFNGDHDGDNSVIKANLPLTVTEKPHTPDFPGRIVWGGAVDSYNSVPNGVYEWHGCYLMFLVEDNGVYTVHTRNINATSGWATYQINSNLAAMASNTTPLAYVGPNGEDAIGYLKSYDQGSWHKIVYYNADGSADKIIQEICKTIKGNNGNECRNPLRGVWSNGKITVDGKTYTITGSQD